MKNEINIPEHFPALKKEDLIAADQRREKYTLTRDIQAKEYNDAILSRLAKEREILLSGQSETGKQVKCEQCGMELSVELTDQGLINCPKCN